MELASHGSIVFAIDHTDMTCTELQLDNFETKLYNPVPVDQNYRTGTKERLDQRIKDIKPLIQFIQYCGNTMNLQFKNLVMMGYSMGGITAIEAAREFKEIKYCVSIDPYFCPILDPEYSLSKPYIIINSQNYHSYKAEYDSVKCLKDFLAKSKGPANYCCEIPNTSHLNFVDQSVMDCGNMKMLGLIPKTTDSKKVLKLATDLTLGFLNAHGLTPAINSGRDLAKIKGVKFFD
jgi:hypothetical protein